MGGSHPKRSLVERDQAGIWPAENGFPLHHFGFSAMRRCLCCFAMVLFLLLVCGVGQGTFCSIGAGGLTLSRHGKEERNRKSVHRVVSQALVFRSAWPLRTRSFIRIYLFAYGNSTRTR